MMTSRFASVVCRNRRGFVLLEVMVALVILGVTLAAIMRGFLISMHSIREHRVILAGTYLAESLMDDLELEPPGEGNDEGSFGDDPRFGEDFAFYSWEWEIEEVEQDYDDVPSKPLQEIEPLYMIKLRIIYDDQTNRRMVPVELESYLLDNELFTDESMRVNQLF